MMYDGERNITDEEVVVAAEKNEDLSFHDKGPTDLEDDVEVDDNDDFQDQPDPMVTSRSHGKRKFTEELKKSSELAAEASFAIANFDGLIAM
uniref:Uncharacterized protein n=1 Tax=Plectus sambesii TaxID=2011161 RepID=A0A914WPC3_9BILA